MPPCLRVSKRLEGRETDAKELLQVDASAAVLRTSVVVESTRTWKRMMRTVEMAIRIDKIAMIRLYK